MAKDIEFVWSEVGGSLQVIQADQVNVGERVKFKFRHAHGEPPAERQHKVYLRFSGDCVEGVHPQPIILRDRVTRTVEGIAYRVGSCKYDVVEDVNGSEVVVLDPILEIEGGRSYTGTVLCAFAIGVVAALCGRALLDRTNREAGQSGS